MTKKQILSSQRYACFIHSVVLIFAVSLSANCQSTNLKTISNSSFKSERIKLNEGWRFMRYSGEADKLIYEIKEVNDSKVGD